MERRGRKKLPLSHKKRQEQFGLEEKEARHLDERVKVSGTDRSSFIAQIIRDSNRNARNKDQEIESKIEQHQKKLTLSSIKRQQFDERISLEKEEILRLKKLKGD